MVCKHCGCTDEQACEGGCSWLLAEVCDAPACVLEEHMSRYEGRRGRSHRARIERLLLERSARTLPRALAGS